MTEVEGEGEGPKPEPPLTEEELSVRREVHEKVFADPACDLNASARAAVEERTAKGQADVSRLTYAELDFATMAYILNLLKGEFGPLCAGGTFLDLGSGTGRVLFAAGMLHPFAKCVGIEISEKLHGLASGRLGFFNSEVAEGMPEQVPRVPIELLQGDCFAEMANVADVSVLFCNATCFDEEDMKQVGAAAKAYGQNVVVVTITRMLPDTETWALLGCNKLETAYGQVTCFVHKKVPPEPTEADAAQGGG